MAQRRRPTSTSAFGAGRRESHDATRFYDRFEAPTVSPADGVTPAPDLGDGCFVGDARSMAALPDNSVALVVTSPPYFAGKEYEAVVGVGHVPASYLAYLDLLRDVFAECRRVLEPGGRIAVNVANLGRRPYRSLAADVTGILQDDLALLLRGEVVWVKADGAAGSCAWGSFRSPANPVLRDLSERVVIAAKGRFDRALKGSRRRDEGLPHEVSITNDEFMDATLDVWRIPAESASRVGHPAPFPVELPQRLIELYTYRGDLVVDPFMGSGSTLVAAARTGRRFAGYDTDPAYVDLARARVAEELSRPPAPAPPSGGLRESAMQSLAGAGFTVIGRDVRLPAAGLSVSVVATDAAGLPWYFDLSGGYTVVKGGLARTDVAWRALGRAAALAGNGFAPVVLLTSHLPGARSEAGMALRATGPSHVFDAIEVGDPEGGRRLAAYAKGGAHERPLPGFWPAERRR